MSAVVSRNLYASSLRSNTAISRRSVSSENSRLFKASIQSAGQSATASVSTKSAVKQSTESQNTVTTLGPWRFVATPESQAQAAESLQTRWSMMAAAAQPQVVAQTAQPAQQAATAAAVTTSNPLEALRAEMLKKGMNPDSYNLSYVETPVSYPGGGYVNKMIVCDFGDRQQCYSADLTLKNPAVTALEIFRGV